MFNKDAHTRVRAAHSLLMQPTTSREKFSHIRSMIAGLHPKLDEALARADQELSRLDKVLGGEVFELSAEQLPENTEEEKRRKKAILFFFKTWDQLKSEVARVEKEMASAESGQTSGQVSSWGRIFGYAKGPLGFVTVVAVGIVALKTTAVDITITNQGCPTMVPSVSLPISIPGISLPTDPIPSGGKATATIPGLTFTIDGSNKGQLTAKALTFSMSFELGTSIDDVRLDGASLLGKTTSATLSEKDEHELRFVCGA